MKKKIWLIPVVCVALIAVLWLSGLIPKQIARIAGTNYVKEHFPEMELEYKGVEWADVYGDFLISFEDKDGNKYSCVIGPSLFPTSLGQGLFAISDYYNENYGLSNVGGADGPETVYSNVAVSKTVSDDQESSYEVSAYLPGTDFSTIGQSLSDKIEQEWNTYNSMTKEQQLTSSKLWGLVGIQVDSWNECEETIGFEVFNPIEPIGWLNATGYFGMESADPNTEVKHILINANTMQTATNVDGNLTEITISSGYASGNAKITLTATLRAKAEAHTTGSVTNGYATYEQETVNCGSGIPVLIVTTNESNNTGYYNGDYYDPTAYWVKDGVFYTLRVFGEEVDQDEIRMVLDRILAEI